MINLLSGKKNHFKWKTAQSIYYYIVLIGAGGTGGYTVQRLTKMMSAFDSPSFLMIADPDIVEEKNLLRQPFIKSDIGRKKADVLATRYGTTYGLMVGSYSDSYIESVEQLELLFSQTDFRHKHNQHIQKVLIGAVDNDYSRKIMNDYFNMTEDLIYIDAGIEGVFIPEGNRPNDKWSKQELTDHYESGNSGQVVVGVKKEGSVILPALNEIYPIDSSDSIPPSHNCGLQPYQPQRMIANEAAALHITTIVNELFSTNSILVHYTNFNSRTSNCRPVYVE